MFNATCNIENHIAVGDYYDDAPEPQVFFCVNCGQEIEDAADAKVVTVAVRSLTPSGRIRWSYEHYCNSACVSRQVYQQTPTLTGKFALARFVIALHLLDDEDITRWAPMERYGLDEFAVSGEERMLHTSIAAFREQASALLNLLSPDDSVNWANDARAVADRLSQVIG